MSKKLIVILLDGVGADLFEQYRHRLPHLQQLARQGTLVQRLGADANANSMPARAGILTGVDATRHGVYANDLWDGQRFRPAAAGDLQAPTLARYARAQGKRVASIGFGLVSEEDCDWFLSPWWQDGCLRAKSLNSPDIHSLTGNNESLTRVAANDHRLLQQAWKILDEKRPDLLLLELNSPDYCQHVLGNDRELVAWSLELVDAQLGCLLTRLRDSDLDSQYNLAIISDHGHQQVETALVVEHIIPEVSTHCDGGLLFVKHDDATDMVGIGEKLAVFGVRALDNRSYLPTEKCDRLSVFVAPPHTSFEPAAKHGGSQPTAKPRYISTHGMGPDQPGDDRIAIFAGPDVRPARLARADSLSVMPLLVRLMGLFDVCEEPQTC
ncbi:alkaline phosphatase family protein [Oceanisphaera sediminis]